jgi:hypothetical protein
MNKIEFAIMIRVLTDFVLVLVNLYFVKLYWNKKSVWILLFIFGAILALVGMISNVILLSR